MAGKAQMNLSLRPVDWDLGRPSVNSCCPACSRVFVRGRPSAALAPTAFISRRDVSLGGFD